MSRPFSYRHISRTPAISTFKPIGIPITELDEITLTLDEFEALRLADHERLYHEEAANRMNVSRTTFGRILDAARHKLSGALVLGRALRIEGGPVHLSRAGCCRRRRS
ncbi:MAG: DUF134 domain-containing protein [Candidatus Eisenbacteria bacterium]|nr:DUF134 domain-containing protein [Candidatus Latescibacterota bacterium]MBD3302836.1 DUF134 domain-containing protein [Candidatus Eisenbacteria bacterium]